ncbi:hypothetical protein QTI05_22590 [Variovorax sp. J22R193]|uniref:hypothetical protein n=1 Tax=Variovorax fucosicus TaxID=3053517 RepID=UPI00257728BB|nr:hypothetical protein [Variovorax sp. J22R193]MDM0041846.1 hypothetical protein [Variovorax sp. J22R193]
MSTVALFRENTSVADDWCAMKDGAPKTRKAIVTDEHREEARLLKKIWSAQKRPTQAVFGETYGIGGQSAVNNFLNGVSALSMRAAKGFARGLGCEISEFSPRLAKEASELGALVTPGGAMTAREQMQAYSIPGPVNIGALQALGKALEEADPEARKTAEDLLKKFVENPSAHADFLPLIARRLSGEIPKQQPNSTPLSSASR